MVWSGQAYTLKPAAGRPASLALSATGPPCCCPLSTVPCVGTVSCAPSPPITGVAFGQGSSARALLGDLLWLAACRSSSRVDESFAFRPLDGLGALFSFWVATTGFLVLSCLVSLIHRCVDFVRGSVALADGDVGHVVGLRVLHLLVPLNVHFAGDAVPLRPLRHPLLPLRHRHLVQVHPRAALLLRAPRVATYWRSTLTMCA